MLYDYPDSSRRRGSFAACRHWWRLASVGCLVSLAPRLQAQTLPIRETFTGNAAPLFQLGGVPNNALLTSGGIDPANNGVLRLTNAQRDQTGFAIYNGPAFAGTQGFTISFEYFTYGGTPTGNPKGGDGISVFLFDGSVPLAGLEPGAFGGSLGYAQKRSDALPIPAPRNVPGIPKGYVGVGLDEFGNFSNPIEGRQGGPGQLSSSVTVRGPGDGLNGYGFVTTQRTIGAGAQVPNFELVAGPGQPRVNTRTNALYRKAFIELSRRVGGGFNVTVRIQIGNDIRDVIPILTAFIPELPPATFRFGFAASTGDDTNIHEIRNVEVFPPRPIAFNFTGTTPQGIPLTFNPLQRSAPNLGGQIDSTSLQLVDPATGNLVTTLVVPEGRFTVVDGATPGSKRIVFLPNVGFLGVVTPVNYAFANAVGVPSTLGFIDLTVTPNTVPPGNLPPVALDVRSQNLPPAAVTTTLTLTPSPIARDPDLTGTVNFLVISALPPASQGVLLLNGVPVTANAPIPFAQVSQLQFRPSGTFVGNVVIDYRVIDNLGAFSNTATITIPVVNQAPTPNNVTSATVVGNATVAQPLAPFTPATFGTVGAGSPAGTTIARVTFVSLPPASQGLLFLNGVAVLAGQNIAVADLVNLQFLPSGTFAGNVVIPFTVTDNTGLTSTAQATLTIPVSAPPVGTVPVALAVTNPGVPYNRTTNTVLLPLLASSPTGAIIRTFTIPALPPTTQGTLFVVVGGVITPVAAGTAYPYGSELQFVPSGSFVGNVVFNYFVTDANGLQSTPAAVTIPVTNQPPVARDVVSQPVPVTASAPVPLPPYSLTPIANDFNGDATVATFTVISLPPASAGVLLIGGVPVVAGTAYPFAQVAQLAFQPNPVFTGTSVVIPYLVTDNAPVPASSNRATITIPITQPPAASRPVATDVTSRPVPGNATAPFGLSPFTPATFGTTPSASTTLASITIVSLPPASQGTLFLNGVAVTAGQVIPVGNLAGLQFQPAAGFLGNVLIPFTVSDNAGVGSANTATLTIPVVGNQPPLALDGSGQNIPGNAPPTLLNPTLRATDPDGTIANYRIETLPAPTTGRLLLNGTAITAGQVLTPAQATQLQFQPSGTFIGITTFTYSATDNLGLRSNVATITLNILPFAGVGVAKAVTQLGEPLGNGSVNLTFIFTVVNLGSVPLTNVQVRDNLVITFPLPTTFRLLTTPASVAPVATGTLVFDGNFNGVNNTNLLTSNSTLAVGASQTVTFTVNVVPNGNARFENTARADANGTGGLTAFDEASNSGTNPDPNGNRNPNELNENNPTVITLPATGPFVPGGFSPNGDGINDTFVIQNAANLTVSLQVFNRWGSLVYRSDTYRNDWNGTANEGLRVADTLPDGTYYYIVDFGNGQRLVDFLTLNR